MDKKTKMVSESNAKKNSFRPKLTFFDATSIGVGAIIGAGIFVIIGAAVKLSGPAVVIAMVIAGIVAFFTAISYARLGRILPKEGAGYAFATKFISPFAGFISGWLWVWSNIIAGSTVALGFSNYAQEIVPSLPAPIIAVFVIIALFIVNFVGIKKSAILNNILVGVKILILLVFVIFGITSIKYSNFEPFAPYGISGIFQAAALIFFAYTGFARISTVAEEVYEPEKTIPRAIMTSLGISTLIYILISIIAVGLIGYLAISASNAPLADAIKSLGNPSLDSLIILGGLIATSSVVLMAILGVSRIIFAMARDGMLPKMLSGIYQKSEVPRNAVIISSLLMCVFVFFGFFRIIELTNFSALAGYAITNYAAVVAPTGKKDKLKFISYLGLLSCIGLMVFLDFEAWIDGLALVIIGVVVYYIEKYLRARTSAAKP